MDEVGFESLVLRSNAALRRSVARRVRAAEVDDVVAEVLLVAWRRRAAVPPDPEDARRWLLRVARHQVANAWRSERRRAAVLQRLLLGWSEPAAVHDEDGAALVAAFVALPPQDRHLLLLAGRGCTGAGLADVLGCSVRAAESRLLRARRRLASSVP